MSKKGTTTVRGLLSFSLLAAACGGAGHDTRPATDDDFRAIQRAEATLESASRLARDPDSSCEEAREATGRGARARAAICGIADETADLDARARCRSASDSRARGRGGEQRALRRGRAREVSPPAWAERARRALLGEAVDGVETIRGRRPPLLDGNTLGGLLPVALLVLSMAGAIVRERAGAGPTDPASLLLRALCLAFLAQTAFVVRAGIARVRAWIDAPRAALALDSDGLVVRDARGEVAVARADVLAIKKRGDFREPRTASRWTDVHVVSRPSSGRTHVTLPPGLEASPGILAERLMRWRGAGEPTEDAGEPRVPEPPPLPSKVYDESAAGRPPPGAIPIPHGARWILRGPYAMSMLGIAVAEGWLRLDAHGRALIDQRIVVAAIALAILAPLAWTALMLRSIRSRKGLVFVFTDGALLERRRSGVRATAWSDIASVSVRARTSFAVITGFHTTATMVVGRRKDVWESRYDQEFVGVPVEVAAALIDAYRKGSAQLRRAAPRASPTPDSSPA